MGNGPVFIEAAASLEQGFEQGDGLIVGQSFLFPGVHRVKNGIGLALGNGLVVKGYHVGGGQAGFLVIKPPDLLEMGCGDFFHIFADFDFGDDAALAVFNGGQLVYAAENGGAAGGD